MLLRRLTGALLLLAIDRACRILGRSSVGISQEAMDVLVGYSWPGNVRELELVLQLAVDAQRVAAVPLVIPGAEQQRFPEIADDRQVMRQVARVMKFSAYRF